MDTLTKSLIRHSRLAFRQVFFSKRLLSLWWGYAGMLVVNLLAYPILTNYYTPHQFGELAIYTNIVLSLAGIGSLTFEKAIVLARSRARTINLFYISIKVLLLTCGLSGGAIGFFYEPVSVYFHLSPQLKLWWHLMPLIVFASGAYYAGNAFLLRKGSYQELSKARILLRSATLVFQLLIAFFVGYESGLVAGFAAGFLLIFSVFFLRYIRKVAKHRISLSYLKNTCVSFSDFPKYSFPQKLLIDLATRVPFLAIPFFFGISEAGYFSLAYGLLSIPESIVAAATGESFFRRISSNPLPEIKKDLIDYWLVLFLIGFLPFFFLFNWGEQLLVLFLGNDWKMTGSMISYMAPMFLFSFIRTPTSTALMVMRKQKYSLYFGAAALIMRPAIFYLGYINGNIFNALAFWVVLEIFLTLMFLRVTYFVAAKHV